MLLRLIAENILSFKDATEFNTFPLSKSHNHDNHRVECGHASILRMSAIYGANGAGKSNLLNVLELLQTMVKAETLNKLNFFNLTFKLDPQCVDSPSGVAIEFYNNNNIFYYHVEFTSREILMEELLLSQKNKDVELFTRRGSEISINSKYAWKGIDSQFKYILKATTSQYVWNGINSQFKDIFKRIVRPNMLLLSFLGNYYSEETPIVADAYRWFTDKLQLVFPKSQTGLVPHLLNTNSDFAKIVSETLPELKTGISQLKVKKTILTDDDIKEDRFIQLVKRAKDNPGTPQKYFANNDIMNIIYEDGNVYVLKMVAIHTNNDGSEVEFPLQNESDGTRRLIEYMPLLFDIINSDSVYVVDEIERSLHPIMIKDIIRKISESKSAKGQLIFTTHESCLLDQSIFRPDEIWFAQKDVEQATQLYPLSDFNIHKTANIENGYLDGRYGGIPFLSNLKDLHW